MTEIQFVAILNTNGKLSTNEDGRNQGNITKMTPKTAKSRTWPLLVIIPTSKANSSGTMRARGLIFVPNNFS